MFAACLLTNFTTAMAHVLCDVDSSLGLFVKDLDYENVCDDVCLCCYGFSSI